MLHVDADADEKLVHGSPVTFTAHGERGPPPLFHRVGVVDVASRPWSVHVTRAP